MVTDNGDRDDGHSSSVYYVLKPQRYLCCVKTGKITLSYPFGGNV